MLLVALNHAYDKHSLDVLLLLKRTNTLWISGDGLLNIAAAVASGLIESTPDIRRITTGITPDVRLAQTAESGYTILLSAKGKQLVEAWMAGRQDMAINV
jgi:hypothetical protein